MPAPLQSTIINTQGNASTSTWHRDASTFSSHFYQLFSSSFLPLDFDNSSSDAEVLVDQISFTFPMNDKHMHRCFFVSKTHTVFSAFLGVLKQSASRLSKPIRICQIVTQVFKSAIVLAEKFLNFGTLRTFIQINQSRLCTNILLYSTSQLTRLINFHCKPLAASQSFMLFS